MAQHKFAVGQAVAFLPTSADGNVRRGQYTVQRLLPSEQGQPQYRVRHAQDGHERVVTESQLSQSTAAPQLSV
jgi:hypothetical protein